MLKRVQSQGVGAGGLALAMLMSTAVAQVVPPAAQDTPQPQPPENRFGMPIEGWMVVRFGVLADGSTTNVRVVDKMPPSLTDNVAENAVEQWIFTPAMADGEAVEWHNNEAVFVFDAEQVPNEPSPRFFAEVRETEVLVGEGDLEKALRNSERLIEVGQVMSRFNEPGLALFQHMDLNLRLGDYSGAYAAALRATDPRINVLSPENLPIALYYRNFAEVQLRDFVGALETLERRKALGAIPDDDPILSNEAALQAAVASEEPLMIRGRIIDDVWRHRPARRNIELGVESGRIDSLLVECDRRAIELDYTADAGWTLPESWGDCLVTVQGRDGAEFTFYEFH